MSWVGDKSSFCDRIGAALKAMGYQAPVNGVTDEAHALRLIAEALEDLRGRIAPDDHLTHVRLNIEMSERLAMERQARGEKL